MNATGPRAWKGRNIREVHRAQQKSEAESNATAEVIDTIVGSPSGQIPFTQQAEKLLELSLREALQLGHNYIDTEHISLGLTREDEGVAA